MYYPDTMNRMITIPDCILIDYGVIMILMNSMNPASCRFMNANYKYYIILVFSTLLLAANQHPIFLIHGFMGWGKTVA